MDDEKVRKIESARRVHAESVKEFLAAEAEAKRRLEQAKTPAERAAIIAEATAHEREAIEQAWETIERFRESIEGADSKREPE
jgi:hypothetical protein